MQQYLIDRSLIDNLASPPIGKAHECVLSDDELKKVYSTVWHGSSSFHRLITLLLLLGLRKTEVASARWNWFDERTRTLTIPGAFTKNKRTLTVQYGSSVSVILEWTPRLSETYLFPAARDHMRGKPTTFMTGYSDTKRAFDEECSVIGWVLHDCRRVVATGL